MAFLGGATGRAILRKTGMTVLRKTGWLVTPLFLVATWAANATLLNIPIVSLSGTIDPITYTRTFATASATFTTSPINVTLSNSSPSFFTLDTDTGLLSDHVVMDVSFNDGNNSNVLGILTIDESGPGPTEFVPGFSTVLNVESATMTGAGAFNDVIILGPNPVIIIDTDGPFIFWCWLCEPLPSPSLAVTFPPPAFDGGSVTISGAINGVAQLPVPEPSSMSLLAIGLLALVAFSWRTASPQKDGGHSH